MPSKLYVFLSYLVSRVGCGILLYRFLIDAFSSTLPTEGQLMVFFAFSSTLPTEGQLMVFFAFSSTLPTEGQLMVFFAF